MANNTLKNEHSAERFKIVRCKTRVASLNLKTKLLCVALLQSLAVESILPQDANAVLIQGKEFEHAGTLRSIDIASCGAFINSGTFGKPGTDRDVSFTEDSDGPLSELDYTITGFSIRDVNHIDGKQIGVVNKINPNDRKPSDPFGGTVTILGRYQGREVTLLTGNIAHNPINDFSHRGYFQLDPKTRTWTCGTVLCANNKITLDLLVNVTGGVFKDLFSGLFLEGRFVPYRTLGDDFEARGAFSLFLPGSGKTEPPTNPVPEPSSLLLLASSAFGLRRFSKRKVIEN